VEELVMFRKTMVIALAGFFLVAGPVAAADVPISTATGMVEKGGKDSLTIRPRRPDGKFDKSLVIKVAGTSKVFLLTTRMQGKKTIAVQNLSSSEDLKRNMPVTVVYIKLKDGAILLYAVAQPAK
jgi:hypothetical protein